MKWTKYHTFSDSELVKESEKPTATELEVELGNRLAGNRDSIPSLLQEVIHFPRNEE